MAVGLLNNCESICRRLGGATDFRLKFVASLSQVLGAREDRGNAAFSGGLNLPPFRPRALLPRRPPPPPLRRHQPYPARRHRPQPRARDRGRPPRALSFVRVSP